MNGTGNLTVDNDNTAAVQVGPGMGIGADTTNWHHYAITRAGSGPTATKIYQDGVDVTNFASDQTFSSNSMPLSIGRYYDGSFPATGTLDEVALYNKVLTSTQVNSHYAAAYPATSSSDPTGLDGAILRARPGHRRRHAGQPDGEQQRPEPTPDHRLRHAQPVPVHPPARHQRAVGG